VRVKILCLHNNDLFHQCAKWVLSRDDRFREIELTNVDRRQGSVESCLASARPDVVILDLGLPHREAVELTRHVKEATDSYVILIVPESHRREVDLLGDNRLLLLECLEAGVRGLVLESSAWEDLGNAVALAMKGDAFCSTPLLKPLFQELGNLARHGRWERESRPTSLTRREREVLQWIAAGLSNKEVARKLCLSLYTVKTHVHKILNKLQATDRDDAVRRALASESISRTWMASSN
jgi:DNA-binding NarL/FixJ family response regulator